MVEIAEKRLRPSTEIIPLPPWIENYALYFIQHIRNLLLILGKDIATIWVNESGTYTSRKRFGRIIFQEMKIFNKDLHVG